MESDSQSTRTVEQSSVVLDTVATTSSPVATEPDWSKYGARPKTKQSKEQKLQQEKVAQVDDVVRDAKDEDTVNQWRNDTNTPISRWGQQTNEPSGSSDVGFVSASKVYDDFQLGNVTRSQLSDWDTASKQVNDEIRLPCEFCEQLFSIDGLFQHQIDCQMNPNNANDTNKVTFTASHF